MAKGKPFVKWAGGKRQIMSELKKYTPADFNSFYEPFVGGGALFFELFTSYGKSALARNQRVIQYDLQGNAIKIWESIKEASEELGVSQEGISACCRGIHKTSGGYAWTYANIQNIRMRWKKKD